MKPRDCTIVSSSLGVQLTYCAKCHSWYAVSPQLARLTTREQALKRLVGLQPKYTVMSEEAAGAAGTGDWYKDRDGPPNKDKKQAPRGAEDCLLGLTFVVTGVLDSLERSEAEDFVSLISDCLLHWLYTY